MIEAMELLSLQELIALPADSPIAAEIHVQLTQCLKKTTRNNKPYLDVTLADGEQSLTLKVWEDKPWFTDFIQSQPKSFLSIKGIWNKNSYGHEGNDLQIRPLSPEETDMLFLGSPELKNKQDRDWESIVELIGSMSDPRLHALCTLFCTKFRDRLKRTAAARNYHHARRGGIIEHIGGMMRCAHAVCSVYPDLNRDLVLAGCLFHDCGKLWENCYPEGDFSMPYTEVGELLGHIPFGIELVNKLWVEIMDSPESSGWLALDPPSALVRLHLLHMIASHHGELAFGSPVPPKTPEAAVLHYIDNLDAKVEMFRSAYTTSEQLSPHVFQRKAPLAGNEVLPLPAYTELPPAPAYTEPEEEPNGETLF